LQGRTDKKEITFHFNSKEFGGLLPNKGWFLKKADPSKLLKMNVL